MATTIFQIPMLWGDSTKPGTPHPLTYTAAEFKEHFLWGLPLNNPVLKQDVPDRLMINKILAAQDFIESYLGVKLFKQIITETHDFVREEFMNWAFIHTTYQVNKAYSCIGRINEQQQIVYPQEWLNIKQDTSGTRYPHLYIVPNGLSAAQISVYAITYGQFFTFAGARIIPNYWQVQYCTGFDTIPPDIIHVIGKLAAVYILPIIEMSIGGVGGAMFGLANQSISLDGLSQSVSKANNGNIFSQRLKQYGEELKIELPQLKAMYGGIKFTVM